MAKRYDKLSENLIEFIQHQKIFFVGTASDKGTINVSPKGYDSLRVIDSNHIVWLNITGSGNETAAHLLQNDRMTIMFCAFDDNPKILRLYGKAQAIHPRDKEWKKMASLFENFPSARQYLSFTIELAQTSCGFGVPFYDYKQSRDNMDKWLEAKSAGNMEEYWREKNQISLDGLPTNIT
tara:strand:- start:1104 stop:1643 length:540 start_codon:yes stop_codon:yes gene_type:complete